MTLNIDKRETIISIIIHQIQVPVQRKKTIGKTKEMNM